MILAHTIVGALPLQGNEFSWFWFAGSVIPDIDHVFVLVKHRLFSWTKFVDSIRFEEKYGIRYKTKYFHSLFGSMIMSIPILLYFDSAAALYFFGGYVVHLLLDWPDQDEKQYLFPLRKKFRGFLPIFSKPEIVFTFFISCALVISYL